jgi:hypothetical protein
MKAFVLPIVPFLRVSPFLLRKELTLLQILITFIDYISTFTTGNRHEQQKDII